MIAKLRGVVDEVGADFVVLDVSGVGYCIFCSTRTLSALPEVGEKVTLFTDLLSGENAVRLVGFLSALERDWFRLLNSIQGVGTKVALSVLSVLPIHELARAVERGDRAVVTRAPGVGPKVARRIVDELKDRLPPQLTVFVDQGEPFLGREPAVVDAISALVNLGYSRMRAERAIADARGELGNGVSVELLIQRALKGLNQ